MKQLTEIEITKAAMLKSYRAAIRMKHSLRADAEIAKALPLLEAKIDNALHNGKTFELNPSEAFDADNLCA